MKAKKDKIATEGYVWAVVNGLEEKMDKRFDENEQKQQTRFDKMMTALTDIAG